MKPRRQRLYFAILSVGCLAIATYMILTAFQDNIVFFRTPTDIMTKPVKPEEKFRVGGLVKAGSLVNKDENVSFVITDNANDLHVIYTGILPTLFREEQGVVAYGSLNADKVFVASEILAKHDEKYMPPEVYKALKERGYLRDSSNR